MDRATPSLVVGLVRSGLQILFQLVCIFAGAARCVRHDARFQSTIARDHGHAAAATDGSVRIEGTTVGGHSHYETAWSAAAHDRVKLEAVNGEMLSTNSEIADRDSRSATSARRLLTRSQRIASLDDHLLFGVHKY